MGEIIAGMVLLILFLSAVFLIVTIFFLISLQRVLERCSPECRTMPPGQVWLLLIPLFNFVWQFIVVIKISESLANEFRKRGIAREPEPGKTLGLAFCILDVCTVIPVLGMGAGIAGLICWAMYWSKISEYSNELAIPAGI
jgi:hypothetical protein